MSDPKQKCFIIMPITTPALYLDGYGGDADHFDHVCECLFGPAIIAAGMEPVPPSAKGSESIPAGIISNLQSCEWVLCDLSTHNPNVFFECGIRTSLNKPVIFVRDEKTAKIPFDVQTINAHSYDSELVQWKAKNQITLLAAHIKESVDSSTGVNALWKYYGMRAPVNSKLSEITEADKNDYIMQRLDELAVRMDIVSNGQDITNAMVSDALKRPEPVGVTRLKQLSDLYSFGTALTGFTGASGVSGAAGINSSELSQVKSFPTKEEAKRRVDELIKIYPELVVNKPI